MARSPAFRGGDAGLSFSPAFPLCKTSPAPRLVLRPLASYFGLARCGLSLLFSPISYSYVDILGIDIGGSGIKGAPVNIETGRLTAPRYRIDTPHPATPKAVAKTVQKIAQNFEWKGRIGCAIPARVKHGVLSTATNIDKGWLGTDASLVFMKKTGLPVHVINDADAAGVAEMAFGSGRSRPDLVLLLTIGTGIGSALFIEQMLVPNTELGHVELNGKNGELFASDRTRQRKKLTWKQWAKRLQKYLDRIEFLLAPDLIIIGGGVSRPERLEKYFDRLKTTAELVPATLQNEAGIIGAAFSARHL